jgi:hypothetical protein
MKSVKSTIPFHSCEYCELSHRGLSIKASTHTLCIRNQNENGWNGTHEPLDHVCDMFIPNKEALRPYKINQL